MDQYPNLSLLKTGSKSFLSCRFYITMYYNCVIIPANTIENTDKRGWYDKLSTDILDEDVSHFPQIQEK